MSMQRCFSSIGRRWHAVPSLLGYRSAPLGQVSVCLRAIIGSLAALPGPPDPSLQARRNPPWGPIHQ
eukprot:375207-Pyramimonas_sp.AAC.1